MPEEDAIERGLLAVRDRISQFFGYFFILNYPADGLSEFVVADVHLSYATEVLTEEKEPAAVSLRFY